MLPEPVRRTRPAALVAAEYVGNGAYGLGHPSLLRSGATASERRRQLPVQLGYGRGGYYGDLPWWHGESGRGADASVDRIMPQFQRPDVGDVLLDGADCDADHGAWTVRLIEPGRSLVLFSSRTLDGREVDPGAEPNPRLNFDCSWAFVLVPDGDAPARLLVRSRLRVEQATHQQAAATGVAGVPSSSDLAVALAMAWLAHIGMDRALGLGLQRPDGSRRTHLRRARRASNHPGLGGGAWTG